MDGKFSSTWIRRCEVLWPTIETEGDQSRCCLYVYVATLRMSASHTTPSPSTGLASGGVPTEAS